MKRPFSALEVAFVRPVDRLVRRRCLSPFRTFLPRRMRLLRDLIWRRPDGTVFIVPANAESDGASIPLILEPFLPDRLLTAEAAFVHDWLCQFEGIPLSYADAHFRQALRDCTVSAFYAYVCYLGLRLASPWRERARRVARRRRQPPNPKPPR